MEVLISRGHIFLKRELFSTNVAGCKYSISHIILQKISFPFRSHTSHCQDVWNLDCSDPNSVWRWPKNSPKAWVFIISQGERSTLTMRWRFWGLGCCLLQDPEKLHTACSNLLLMFDEKSPVTLTPEMEELAAQLLTVLR